MSKSASDLKVEVVCLIIDPTHSRRFDCFSTNFWPISFNHSSFESFHEGDLAYLKRFEYKILKRITRQGNTLVAKIKLQIVRSRKV